MASKKAKPIEAAETEQQQQKRPRRRTYEGALTTRLTANWITSSTSADAEIDGSLIRLRNRSRQLVRDSPYARQAIRAIGANVIGQGIRMQGRVRMQRGNRLNEQVNRRIETAWQSWCHADRCHVGGRLSMAEILRLAIMAVAESGEVFLRIIPEAFGRSRVPLGIEIIESDYCDEGKSYGKDANGDQWRMGVKVNRWGRPISYAFRTVHPGDIANARGGKVIEVPADEIIHLFITERPGQTRGAPWVSSAIKRLHHLDGYEEAEVVRARANSSLMGFIQSPEGELEGDEVYDDERVSRFEPGVFKYLAPGETINVPQLDAPDGQFEPFLRGMLRSVAAAIGCSYETISRDFSQSNYSSSRLSLLEDREQWRMLQDFMIEHLAQPVYERWLAAAVASGQLRLPDYETMPERYETVQWHPRGWAWVDPQKEVQAYRDAVRAGFKTQAQVIAESGGDLEDLLTARSNEVDRAEQLGLQFDTNPADDQQGGAPNATPEQQPDPTTEE
ncbi:MAG: phage portal protein [Synechococcaceae bacterium WB9_4xC_028]|nr:phage portal protein [Synechococcaceae bacterium WB9_4xC_028]